MRPAPAFLFSKRKGGKKRPKGRALNSHGEFNGVKHSLPGSGPPINASPADSNLSRADLEVDVYVRLSQPAVPPGSVSDRNAEAATKSRLVLPPKVKFAAGQIRLMSAGEIFLTATI